MDPTEDLSARVLLKHILSTEPPRTPITRSASQKQSTSATRRSSRLTNKLAGAQTPQAILRRSLTHKIHESITRKSLPATKRRTASFVRRKTNTPAPASVLFDDGDTPRHVLMNILRTEPVRSPVVHKKPESVQPQPSSANSSITSNRPSIELSGTDLPDITIGTAAKTAKRLSRKRPRRSLNVTAFEKRLKDAGDVEEESEESIGDHSSLSLSSSTSLTLKTPFGDLRTEKRGLQRRASNRRKITEEEFGAAVDKRQMGGGKSFVEPGPSDTAYSEGFTLGLSKLSEPDITNDIVHCNTALYAQSDAVSSNFSIVATQDKPTVMASQIQVQMIEVKEEELMEVEQNTMVQESSMYLFPTEEEAATDLRIVKCFSLSQPKDDADAAEHQEEGQTLADGQPADAALMLALEEEEGTPESQTTVRDGTLKFEEENGVDGKTEEEVVAGSQNEDEDGGVDSQTEEGEEEGEADSQLEEETSVSQSVKEEDVSEDESGKENPAEAGSADSQAEDEHEGQPEEEDVEQASEQLEHISRRAHCSQGGVMPVTEAREDLVDVTEAGCSDGISKAHSAIDAHGSLEMESHEPHTGIPDLAESSTQGQTDASRTEAEKESSFRLSIEDSARLSDSPGEAAAQAPAEQEEEWEDEEEEDVEESEEVPSKTPAFVREKRAFVLVDPLASPVLKNAQVSSTGDGFPAPKAKQMRKKTRPAKREGGLPKSYLMSTFKHFAKTKVSADVYPVLKDTMDKFFERMAADLETYAVHAKRKTIEVEDAELLLRRQGYVNDKVPVEVLIEKYLRMDQRKLLIPIATSGNVVIPTKRR